MARHEPSTLPPVGCLRCTRAAAAIGLDLSGQEGALDDYVLSGSEAAHQRYVDAGTGLDEGLARLRVLAVGNEPVLRRARTRWSSSSRRWRDRVALPTIVAMATGDSTQVQRFSDQAGGDHVDVDLSLFTLAAGLDVADQEIIQQGASTETVKLAGTAIAFGFMLVAFLIAILVVRRFGRALERESSRAGVLVRFTEVSSFATDDREIVAANLIALDRIAAPDGSVTHLLNRSMDRAVAEGATGDAPSETLSLHALSACAGMIRRSLHVAEDLSDALTVHCPVYPATTRDPGLRPADQR